MVMIVGHRGARNLWPENGLDGFRRLLALGVEAVEFDVHETRDRHFVVIHDPTLDRTTHASGAIRGMTLAEVASARLRPAPGSAEEPAETVPSLDAVLDLLSGSALELHIEIKTDALGEVHRDSIGRLVDHVRRRDLGGRAILTCFVPEVLDTVRDLWPQARILASLDHRSAEMMGGLSRALARLSSIPGCIVAVQKELLSVGWNECFAALGADRLGAWVPNEPADLARWMAMPIRQVTTDRPDLALEARSRR